MTFDAFPHRFAASSEQGTFVALGVAVLAGIMASGVCPCTLPVGLGMAGVIGASESQSRRTGFLIAASFFAGIVVNLMILFGVGRGLLFLLVGVFASAVVRLTRIGVWGRALQMLSGCILLFVSGYYVRAFTALL